MRQSASHPRLPLLVMVLAVFSLVPVARPQDACAKGVPTIATVTGPGLARPIRSSGPDFPAPVGSWPLPALTGAHHYKAAIFAASLDGRVVHDGAPGPDVALGPRYTLRFFVWRRPNRAVRQYLYPFATSGPLTFTPAGQGRAFAHVLGEREISGWWSAPGKLTEWLRREGVAEPSRYRLGSVTSRSATSLSSRGPQSESKGCSEARYRESS